MDRTLIQKIDTYRRLSIRKDSIELSQWIDILEGINHDIDHWKIIEQQLIKNQTIATSLFGLRRKNALITGVFCKYDYELKKEFEHGNREYDVMRAKEHERRRDQFTEMMDEYRRVKESVFGHLITYKRK